MHTKINIKVQCKQVGLPAIPSKLYAHIPIKKQTPCTHTDRKATNCKSTEPIKQHTSEHTVRPCLSGPLLSGSLAIRKKIVGCLFTAYVMRTYSMCVQLSGPLACIVWRLNNKLCAWQGAGILQLPGARHQRSHLLYKHVSSGEELLIGGRISSRRAVRIEMETDNVQRNVIGDVIRDVQKVSVPVKLIVLLQGHADELHLAFRVGMTTDTLHHVVVDVGVGLRCVAVLVLDFVEALPELEIIVVVRFMLHTVFIREPTLCVVTNLNKKRRKEDQRATSYAILLSTNTTSYFSISSCDKLTLGSPPESNKKGQGHTCARAIIIPTCMAAAAAAQSTPRKHAYTTVGRRRTAWGPASQPRPLLLVCTVLATEIRPLSGALTSQRPRDRKLRNRDR